MVRWLSGLGFCALFFGSVGACGGVVESDGTSTGGASSSTMTYACPICSNAKLSCTVNGNADSLVRAATSKTGCAFDFGSNSFSVDCDSQMFCIEGFGCSKYTASGNSISVNSSLGRVNCSPAK
ncbi:MAG TPA: hypothetical protein VHV51_09965 [Polyangiaceae bacterium]|nr:hypothetical protein [Polyangiaceae bacterium]